MKMQTRTYFRGGWGQGFLRWVNLRPEESERTFLMFAFYTTTSIGLLWLETSATALFLKHYGAELLPVIYIASSGLGSGLGFFYSRLQKTLPLRSVLVAIALLMGVPLFLFRVGLEGDYLQSVIVLTTVFLLRLWMDATTVLNDLNTSITANQLFNIREIKRTYPLISSGLLVADVISGFSLPFLLGVISLANITVLAGIMMLLGAGILFYLTQRYQQSFPDSAVRNLENLQPEFKSRRVRGPLQRYVIPLFAFFILGQVLFLVVEFEYLSELERNLNAHEIAAFLGVFSGILGLFELATQWFISSRLIERLGVFVAAMLLPISAIMIGAITLVATTFLPLSVTIFGLSTITHPISLFIGVVCLKFIDELFRYTLIASTGAVLFQPLPETIRGSIQAMVRGIAETLSTGVTGVGILAMIALCYWLLPNLPVVDQYQLQGNVFLGVIVLVAFGWLLTAWLLRSSYVNLLVQSAEQGRLGFSDVDLRAFKRAVIEVLEQAGNEGDKRSCIQLLCQIDPQNTGEILAPLLSRFTPNLQRQSLEVILEHPNPNYLHDVQALIAQQPSPEVLALAFRYIWLVQPELDISSLKPYLRPEVDATVRGTAAALILRRGNSIDKAEATNTLRRMLSHKRERERVMGCRALGEADYLQALRVYVADLLRDDSIRVRCALLDVIASTRQEEYYPSLLRGLYYKSTRDFASKALVKLGDEALPLVSGLAEDSHKPDLVRFAAFNTIATIKTPAALNQLTSHLTISWGTTRRNLLRILLKMPGEVGIEAVLDRLGRSGVETFIEQELLFLGQIYAAQVDLEQINAEPLSSKLEPALRLKLYQEALDLLQRALSNLESDVIDRCFLLMKFLYPIGAIQAASFNLKSDSGSDIAVGLEILDNTVDLPTKRALLGILDQNPAAEKVEILAEILPYQPMAPSDRLRRLLELRHFLSEWTLACCFHLARAAHWSLTKEQTDVCLDHPTGFVREAVLAYLKDVSPRDLQELLPRLKNDPDQIVAAQVQQMMVDLSN
jgi:HEAT repeat protein